MDAKGRCNPASASGPHASALAAVSNSRSRRLSIAPRHKQFSGLLSSNGWQYIPLRQRSQPGAASNSHWTLINSARAILAASPCSSSQSAKIRRGATSSGLARMVARKTTARESVRMLVMRSPPSALARCVRTMGTRHRRSARRCTAVAGHGLDTASAWVAVPISPAWASSGLGSAGECPAWRNTTSTKHEVEWLARSGSDGTSWRIRSLR